MALQRSGVEAVVAGLNKFIADIGKMNKAYVQQGQVAEQASKRVAAAARQLEAAQQRVINQSVTLKGAMQGAAAALSNSVNVAQRLGRALETLRQVELQVANIMQDATKSAAEKAAALVILGKANQLVVNATEAYINALGRQDTANERASRAARNLAASQDNVTQKQQNLTAEQGAAVASAGGLVAAFGQIGAVLAVVWSALGVVGRVLGAFKNIVMSVIGAVAGLVTWLYNLARSVLGVVVGAFQKLWGVVKSVAGAIQDFVSRALSVAAGILFADSIRNIGQSLAELREETIKAISDLQRLTIQFETISARDIAQERFIPIGEAMQYASIRAQELLNWVIQIAVTTPVTVEDIAQALALANAYGIAGEGAKALTMATINFTSAMGLTADHLYRIIYNFGQMQAQGHLTGREFRDLAVSFVPVNEILDEMARQAGITRAEIYQLALKGGVPVEEFFRRFIDLVGRDFPDAARRMARTWYGVQNNLQDFLHTVVGLQVLGPIFNRFTGFAADALEKVLTPAVRLTAQAIGSTLLQAFDRLSYAINLAIWRVGDLLKAFGLAAPTLMGFVRWVAELEHELEKALLIFSAWAYQLSQNMGFQFADLASAARTWGFNIIVSLANGMVAAASYVLTALTQIANWIAQLLAPGSPPKLLPDLPKWGMGAMTEWLKGFTDADFSALSGIQGPLQNALDLLVRTGELGEQAAGDLYTNISMALAEALATGTALPADLFAQIQAAGGPFGAQIAELARLQVELAGATDLVRVAEKRVAAARKAEETARAKVSQGVLEYNALLRAGADPAVLSAKLDQINASEEAAQAASAERAAAETNLETTQTQLEAMEEQVKLQAQLVQQLLDITRAKIIMPDLGALGAGAADLSEAFAGVGLAALSMADKVKAAMAKIMAEKQWEALKKQIQDIFSIDVVSTWQIKLHMLFMSLFGENGTLTVSLKTWKTQWDTLFGPEGSMASSVNSLKIKFEELKLAFAPIGENLALMSTLLDTIYTQLTTGVMGGIIGSFANWWIKLIWTNDILDKINKVLTLVNLGLAVLSFALGIVEAALRLVLLIGEKVVQFFWNTRDAIIALINKIIEQGGLMGILKDLVDNYITKWGTGLEAAHNWLDKLIGKIQGFITAVTSGAFAKAVALWKFLTGGSPSPLAIGIETAEQALVRFIAQLPRFQAAWQPIQLAYNAPILSVAPLAKAYHTAEQALASFTAQLPRFQAASQTSLPQYATATVAAAPVTSAYYTSHSVTFGDTNVYNRMDAALLRESIRQVLRQELG